MNQKPTYEELENAFLFAMNRIEKQEKLIVAHQKFMAFQENEIEELECACVWADEQAEIVHKYYQNRFFTIRSNIFLDN